MLKKIFVGIILLILLVCLMGCTTLVKCEECIPIIKEKIVYIEVPVEVEKIIYVEVIVEPEKEAKTTLDVITIISRQGDSVSELFYLEEGRAVFEITMSGSSNNIIVLYKQDGQYIGLLVNTIDGYIGTKTETIEKSDYYYLEVKSEGTNKIIVKN